MFIEHGLLSCAHCVGKRHYNRRMLEYFRFHADLPHPQPARPVYAKRGKGSGWPEHCPPIRAANAFGWDIINPFTMKFIRDKDGNWDIEEAVEVESDIEFEGGMTPESQLNAWFWERNQKIPHVITDDVYQNVRHQVKISTFLYLRTEPGEMLLIKAVPATHASTPPRPWSVIEALVESDWYFPAHPWHGVIELPRIEDSPIKKVVIPEGEPLFRLVPIARSQYEANEMSSDDFGDLFERGQQWLGQHGRESIKGEMNITGEFARQQELSRFDVNPSS